MAKGKVKWFNSTKGYGFIEPEDGTKDVFIHFTAVRSAGLSTLEEGTTVEYTVEKSEEGRTSAANIKVL
ncbi:MAG: cold-shock protein [Candidatus Babeliales bacterium]